MIEPLSEEDKKQMDEWKKGDRSELKAILFMLGIVVFTVLVAGSKWLTHGFSDRVKVGVLYVPIMFLIFFIIYYFQKWWYHGLLFFEDSPESPEIIARKAKIEIDLDRDFKMVDKVFILSKKKLKRQRYQIKFTNGLILEDGHLRAYDIEVKDLANRTPLEIEYLPKSKHILAIRKLSEE